MVAVLEKAFNKDKAIKAAADDTKVFEKSKKETLELPHDVLPVVGKKEEEEAVILIKSNKVVVPEEVVSDEKIDPSFQKLEGPKVVGKVDLDKPKKATKSAKKEEPAPVAPVEEKVKEEPVVEKVKPKQEEDLSNFIQTKKVEIEGLKVMGKIELKEEKKPTKEEPKPKTEAEKRVRKRIEKPKRERISGGDDAAKRGGFERKPFNKGGDNKGAPPVTEISEKEIEEKIRAYCNHHGSR
jgi:translation initiation factor IF-2